MPVGVVTELVEGDVYHWGSLMAGALFGSLPVAILYSFFVEYYVSGTDRRRQGVRPSHGLVRTPGTPTGHPSAAVAGRVKCAVHRNEEPAMSVQDTIRDQVTQNRVVLYMKGTPQFPQCGFSATVAEILKRCGVDQYFSVNVLADAEIRQGIKEFANWPTIPAALRQRRVRRRLRHRPRDVRVGRTAEGAGDADRLTGRTASRAAPKGRHRAALLLSQGMSPHVRRRAARDRSAPDHEKGEADGST